LGEAWGLTEMAMQIRATPLLHKCDFDHELHRQHQRPLFSFAPPLVGFDG
jgi:hypothetical protein